MNAGLDADHPSIHYYDADYPSPLTTPYPENVDALTAGQGIAHDVARYREIARATGGPVLELCCGTGRVAIPLARAGLAVVGVDVSSGMLEQFRRNLRKEDGLVFSRVTLVEQDVTRLDLPDKAFKLALIPFNSLLLITDFDLQRAALRAAAAHLAPGGTLVVDVVNPLTLKLQGDPVAKPYYTRRSPHGGNLYTMFAMLDPVDANHKQRMHGWYDEVEPDGVVKRRHFELHWRPIFRFELELMLREAGFRVASLEGGQRHEPYTAQSPRLFVRAVRE